MTHVALMGTLVGQTTIDASSTPSASQTTLQQVLVTELQQSMQLMLRV